jgi:hypothetical protein
MTLYGGFDFWKGGFTKTEDGLFKRPWCGLFEKTGYPLAYPDKNSNENLVRDA